MPARRLWRHGAKACPCRSGGKSGRRERRSIRAGESERRIPRVSLGVPFGLPLRSGGHAQEADALSTELPARARLILAERAETSSTYLQADPDAGEVPSWSGGRRHTGLAASRRVTPATRAERPADDRFLVTALVIGISRQVCARLTAGRPNSRRHLIRAGPVANDAARTTQRERRQARSDGT